MFVVTLSQYALNCIMIQIEIVERIKSRISCCLLELSLWPCSITDRRKSSLSSSRVNSIVVTGNRISKKMNRLVEPFIAHSTRSSRKARRVGRGVTAMTMKADFPSNRRRSSKEKGDWSYLNRCLHLFVCSCASAGQLGKLKLRRPCSSLNHLEQRIEVWTWRLRRPFTFLDCEGRTQPLIVIDYWVFELGTIKELMRHLPLTSKAIFCGRAHKSHKAICTQLRKDFTHFRITGWNNHSYFK